jgi:hypothetical protein
MRSKGTFFYSTGNIYAVFDIFDIPKPYSVTPAHPFLANNKPDCALGIKKLNTRL